MSAECYNLLTARLPQLDARRFARV